MYVALERRFHTSNGCQTIDKDNNATVPAHVGFHGHGSIALRLIYFFLSCCFFF